MNIPLVMKAKVSHIDAKVASLPPFGAISLAGMAMRATKPARTASMFGAGGKLLRGDFDIEVYPGQPVPVLHNPSKQKLENFIRSTKHRAVRVLDDPKTGDQYICPADAAAVHGQMAQQSGIPFDQSDPNAGKIMIID